MKFEASREELLYPLQQITGVIEKRQVLPILSNALIKLMGEELILTGTDMEVQLVAKAPLRTGGVAQTTVPARKLLDICRLLPESSTLSIEVEGDKIRIVSGKSRFVLNTLDASIYPSFDEGPLDYEFAIESVKLKKALEKTMFCMAQQDVRYYLNGVMLELGEKRLTLVASDGHRLARYEESLDLSVDAGAQIVLPRKGALELYRLLDDPGKQVVVQFSKSSIRVTIGNVIFSSKLIDGKYPDFRTVFPESLPDTVSVNKNLLKSALSRVATLSDEKYKGISLQLAEGSLSLRSVNPEHDEAEEEVEMENPASAAVTAGFNCQYLLDAVSHVDSEAVHLSFAQTNSRCFVHDADNPRMKFIVMPMRL